MVKCYQSIIIILLLFLIVSCSTESTPVYNLTTSADPAEAGSIAPAQGEFEEGEEIEITATPNEHWIFDSWQGDHTGDTNPATISMESDKDIKALFTKREYPLNIQIEGEGRVLEKIVHSKSTDFPHGTIVELIAEPAEGWAFVGWDGDLEGVDNPIEITIEGSISITATFERIEYPLIISTEGQGTVDENIITAKNTDYPFETMVELTAMPSDGWVFIEWNEDLSGNENPSTITITEETNILAKFSPINELLTLTIDGEGDVEVEQIEAGNPSRTNILLTAIPKDGWRFTQWEGDGTGTDEQIEVSLSSEKQVTAVFSKNIVEEISGFESSNAEFISVTNAGTERMYASTSEILINDNEDGIWVSEDNGNNWSKTYDTGANFIKAASAEPELVIAGLNDGGYVISQDGGITWDSGLINDPFGNSIEFTDASAVDRNSPIYLSSRHATRSGIFKSLNIGGSWQHIFSSSDELNTFGSSIEQLVVVSSHPNTIYARTGFAHDIIKSTNGGNSFTSVKSGLPADITSFGAMRVNHENRDELFIRNNISDTGGSSWLQYSVTASNHFWFDNTLYQVTTTAIRKSNDLGNSWNTVLNFGAEIPGVSGSPAIQKSSDALYLFFSGNQIYKILLEDIQ